MALVTVGDRGHRWQMEVGGGILFRRMRRGDPYEGQLLRRIADHLEGKSGTGIDVGAHVGNHSIYLALVCGLRVHAFEPDGADGPYNDNLPILRANIARNGLEGQITVHPVAAGARPGKARWSERRSALVSDPEGEVEVVTLDERLADVDDAVVMKVDVEGFEQYVLEGAVQLLARCRPLIVTETHTDDEIKRQGRVLAGVGYKKAWTQSWGSPMTCWVPG